jgi:toxin-antitoxin system PIN domain toxin
MRVQPFTSREAMGVVGAWLDRPHVSIVQPTERHWPILRQLVSAAQVRGPLMMDAHLAALAIEHGAALYSNDRDFSRFPGLQWVSPLAAREPN